ncbi:AMP-binding protein [Kitasatospora sp. NPDC058965]|uniref:AMP-binding protein n=1 Tax=Kitasatospora sp. NPDC058965 TaxID=3346682 RepID=UPI00367A2412
MRVDPDVSHLLQQYGDPRAAVAELLCDRHPAQATAFTFVHADLSATDLTYGRLRERSAALAGRLAAAGLGRGDRIATLMGKSEQLVVALLAIWRLGAVQVPLFTAFGPQAVAARLSGSGAKLLLADAAQADKAHGLPVVVPVVGADGGTRWPGLPEDAEPLAEPVAVGGDQPFVELFTSGTTGAPKAVPVPVRAVAAFHSYQEHALDHRAEDVFWNAADPGWGYGLYQAVIGPLALGRPGLLVEPRFTAETATAVLAGRRVTNFAAAPTAYRLLRQAGLAPGATPLLRCASSAGEPLGAEVLDWAHRTLGIPVRDHYGQTELGMVVANAWAPQLRRSLHPGSMGQPLPGWSVRVLRAEQDEPAAAGELGRVVVDLAASPLMWFTGYRGAPARTAQRYSPDGRWYYTGDTGHQDDRGNLFFAARDDDVIIMAGYRIGPHEVEAVLDRHPLVLESAVVAAPDGLRGEVVEAHVVLREGAAAGPGLAAELQALVKTGLSAHAYPRTVHFVAELPRTPSGKVQRAALRGPARAA